MTAIAGRAPFGHLGAVIPPTLSMLALAALLLAGGWTVRQLVRIAGAIRRGRRAIADARRSGRHQAEVRLFVEAQTKLTRLDIQMGALFGVSLVGMLVLAGHLLSGGRAQT